MERVKKEKQMKPAKQGRKSNRLRYLLRKQYVLCGAAISVLIVLAFFGPQLVFAAQDMYQMDRIWQGARNGLDMGKIYSEYGDLRERLEAFSKRMEEDEPFYVAGTEHRVNEDFFDLLDVIVRQEGYEMLLYSGIAPDLSEVVNKGYTVDEWKKYVIYNDISEEETNAVVVSGWYIEFTMRDDVTVKMLVDTETYELYYMQLVDYSGSDVVVDAKSGVKSISGSQGILEYWWYEAYYALLEGEWLGFWFDYYDAGENLIQTFEGYMQGLEENGVELRSYYETQSYRIQRMTLNLPYWENSLKWGWEIAVSTDGKTPNTFSVGLMDIAELIPELQEN